MHPHWDSIQGWFDYPQFYDAVADLVNDHSIVVEVGVWKGKSISYLVDAFMRRQKNNVKFFAVDHWSGHDQHPPNTVYGTCSSIFDEFCNSMSILGIKDKIETIITESHEGAKSFADNSVDFVFIDASHDYDACKKDINAWLPKVKVGGIIAGHDYGSWPGVTQAVKEAFGEVPVFGVCWMTQKKEIALPKPKDIFMPWGWTQDLVSFIWGYRPNPTAEMYKSFKKYSDAVEKDIHYQCVIFARYNSGVIAIDCCDASDWEVLIGEPHIYLKMQYNPNFNYKNNVKPFTYLPRNPIAFNDDVLSLRENYKASKHDLPIWGRWAAVSLERFTITKKMRELGIINGGQYCMVPAGQGYDEHEKQGLLDPVMPRQSMPWNEYVKWTNRAEAIIDARGFGEFTHRMVECFGTGVPLIRPLMVNRTHETLIPGIHYLDCGKDGIKLEECIEQLKDAKIKNTLIRNGLDWYQHNATKQGVLNLVERAFNSL